MKESHLVVGGCIGAFNQSQIAARLSFSARGCQRFDNSWIPHESAVSRAFRLYPTALRSGISR